VIQRTLQNDLAQEILAGKILPNSTVRVTVHQDKLAFESKAG
jgi:ATP-dependent Clp protease ATP-binding subunit ClpA